MKPEQRVTGASAACLSVALLLAVAGCSGPSSGSGFQTSAATTGGGRGFLPSHSADSGAAPARPAPQDDDAGSPGDDASAPATSDDAAPAAPACASTAVAFTVVDYFSGSSLDGVTATVDGAASGTTMCLGTGVHPVQISATGYATYNGAVQIPGGATARTIKLFPATATVTTWLALVNGDRQANGAGAVQLDNALTIAAWDHAVDMGAQGYFAHFDPHGFAPTTRSLLLGSMVMGAENIAAGYPTYDAADAAFMAEKAMLPNQSPSDCAADDSAAGHYCNIVAASHNWVGLAAANVPNGPEGPYYYDQEFGDLYGYYDTTVVPTEPALGASASLTMVPSAGQSFQYEFVQTMPAPTPIPIETLNADPTCSSTCPASDLWYPTGNLQIGTQGPLAYSPSLGENQIVFPTLETQAMPFCGASAYAAFWAGGTVMPDSYGAESQSYLVP